MLLIITNSIFAKTLLFMIETLAQISGVVQKLEGKPMDNIRSYLILTEILKILYNGGLIHYTSFMHMQWLCDYKVMSSTLTGVSKGAMIEKIADNYNRSVPAVERIIYGLDKKRGQ